MGLKTMPVIAWVESPLQLVGAAEWATARGRRIPVAGRLTTQMAETADALIARGAQFGQCAAYLSIPWSLLAQHRHWLVGDGFSGQFRLAAAVLRPRRITFLDDGANTVPLADALIGRRAYARPNVHEGALTTLAAPFALDQIMGRAHAGQVDVFTAFDLGAERRDALGIRGIRVDQHRFAFTRRSAVPFTAPGGRVLLGSALPVDGRMPLADYLAWVGASAATAPVTYLPHRREADAQLAAVAALPGVTVSRAMIPAELLLAGTTGPLEVITLPSSTTTTLPLVLEGSGSMIGARRVPQAATTKSSAL